MQQPPLPSQEQLQRQHPVTAAVAAAAATATCSKCRKEPSVFHRAYSGEYLCRKCFLRSIEAKTAKTISKYSMLRYGDRVAVGVSGGKDSLSLLYILKKLFDGHRNNGNELVAVTIDEGIRGYRDESLGIVKDFCSKLDVESKILSYKSLFGMDMDEAMVLRPPGKKMSSCSICGTFRRRAIDIAAETVGADVVATAHNMDDQLQTFMINLFAGDVERIGWTYPEPVQHGSNNGNITNNSGSNDYDDNAADRGTRKVKPFTEIYEYEIAFYALLREIPFQSEECLYMNESIRTGVREFFNKLEVEHPGIKHSSYNSMMKISKAVRGPYPARDAGERQQLQGQGQRQKKRAKCTACGRVSSGEVCAACMTVRALKG